jgi:hypothetical protein
MKKPMDDYARYSEIATRVLMVIRARDGDGAVMLAAHAMIDAASAIASHELRKGSQRAFPDMPQIPEDDPCFTFFVCGDGTKITTRREPITSPDLPPAAEAA